MAIYETIMLKAATMYITEGELTNDQKMSRDSFECPRHAKGDYVIKIDNEKLEFCCT